MSSAVVTFAVICTLIVISGQKAFGFIFEPSSKTTKRASHLEAGPIDQGSVEATLPHNIKNLWGIQPDISNFPGANFPLGDLTRPPSAEISTSAPPILELPNFLSATECHTIREWAKYAIDHGADECTEYLNARVNLEVDASGTSDEGRTLIDEFDLEETTLAAHHRGGFRIRLDPSFVTGMLQERLLSVLTMPRREFVFEEGAWIRPTPKTVVVRDQTVVFYGPGNGVPPHVDGKDGTLLVYLSNVPEGVGGRTVFPEDGFAQRPVEGTALLYRSKNELLHYSEAMTSAHEKWIMQLLLDFNHDYAPGDVITDFRTGTSYVWDGSS